MSKENRDGKAIRKWAKMKSIGKEKYILINGVAKYGLFMGVVFPIIQQLVGMKFNSNNYNSGNFIFRFLVCFIIFSIGGCITSAQMWRGYEKKFNS